MIPFDKEKYPSIWHLYEQEKREIERTAKTQEEYEARIQALIKKLGV